MRRNARTFGSFLVLALLVALLVPMRAGADVAGECDDDLDQYDLQQVDWLPGQYRSSEDALYPNLTVEVQRVADECDEDPETYDCGPCFDVQVTAAPDHACYDPPVWFRRLDYGPRFGGFLLGSHSGTPRLDCTGMTDEVLVTITNSSPFEDVEAITLHTCMDEDMDGSSGEPGECSAGSLQAVDDGDGEPPPDEPGPVEPPPDSPETPRVYGPDDVPEVFGRWIPDTTEHPDAIEEWGQEIAVRFVGDDQGTVIEGTTWFGNEDTDPATLATIPSCPPVDETIWEMTTVSATQASGWVNQYTRDELGDCDLVSVNPATWELSESGDLVMTWERYDPATEGSETVVQELEASRSWIDIKVDAVTPELMGPLLTQAFWNPIPPELTQRQQADGPVVMLATIEAFPDALAAAGYGGDVGAFTQLLSPTDRAYNLALLGAYSPTPSGYVVIGGTAALPDDVLPDPGDPSTPPMTRVSGLNRFDTAAQLAQAGWPGGADTVYIATGRNYPDALAGGAVAAFGHHPILLVDGERIPDETTAELQRLAPQTIIILGGPAAVPSTVDAALVPYATEVHRVQGPTRVHTAIALSQATFAAGEAPRATLVPGDRPEEALMTAPLGAYTEGPMFLLQSTLPDELVAELARLGVTELTVVTGRGGIPDTLLHDLEQAMSDTN